MDISNVLYLNSVLKNRGGVGSKGSETRDEDFVEHIYPATMHNTMMFFTQKGKCYWLESLRNTGRNLKDERTCYSEFAEY